MVDFSKSRYLSIIPKYPVLNPHTVGVRWLLLHRLEPSIYPIFCDVLNDTERHRAGRFVFDQDRRAYIAAHALKRLLIGEACNVNPRQLRFTGGPFGKPELAADQNERALQFSISHCSTMVTVAVSLNTAVGIDVERCDMNWTELAESAFSALEIASWQGTPEPCRARGLASTWTLKEAFVKATGAGLSQPLDTLLVTARGRSIGFAAKEACEPRDWTFCQIIPDENHVIALAANRASVRVDLGDDTATSIDFASYRMTR